MLYLLLKPLVRLSLWLFYRKIHPFSLRNSVTAGPLLLLANHTASFMDAFLLACYLNRKLHFFARGDVFRHSLAARLLRLLGIMPVYRKSEGRDKLALNYDSHQDAMRVLQQGGAVLIFCEGNSDIRKQLKPLKKGPFRLATDAVAKHEIPLHILPVGINYSSPIRPGSEVFLQAARPIVVSDFLKDRSDAGRAKAATDLMRATESELLPLVWHCNDTAQLDLADAVMEAIPLLPLDSDFEQTQDYMAAINSGSEDRETLLHTLTETIRQEACKKDSMGARAALWLSTPFAELGHLFHLLPVSLSMRLTKRYVQAPDFIAPVLLCCLILTIAGWYFIWLIGLLLCGGSALWLLLLPAFAGCGFCYLKNYRPLREKRKLIDRAISRLEAFRKP